MVLFSRSFIRKRMAPVAVDMAKDKLKSGHGEQLRRPAREIVATEKEVKMMRDAVSEGPSSASQSASINGAVAHGGMQISQ
jgi:uncharacterized protein (DUF305 family)